MSVSPCPDLTTCPPICRSVFDRVIVNRAMKTLTLVSWELLPTFLDPLPYTFQLQVGNTAGNDSNDWVGVGLPVMNTNMALDGESRVEGKTRWTHYRVVLTTSQGTYISDPVGAMGTLDFRDWRIAQEIIRKQLLDYRLSAQECILLKRRVTGQRCKLCLDTQTWEVQNPDCPSCWGTGYECGYLWPVHCHIWAKMSPRSHRTELDSGQSRGTVADLVVRTQMLMLHPLFEDDIVVVKRTDDRYFVHRIQHTAEIRGVPILGEVELRPIAYSSVIYNIEIPQQLNRLDELMR